MMDPEAGKFNPVVPLASAQFVPESFILYSLKKKKFHPVVPLAEVKVHALLFRILN